MKTIFKDIFSTKVFGKKHRPNASGLQSVFGMYTDATEIVFFLALLLLTKFFYVVNLQNETDKDIPTIGLLICALISENQGLEKSRSASNIRNMLSSANLDFFSLALHLEKS